MMLRTTMVTNVTDINREIRLSFDFFNLSNSVRDIDPASVCSSRSEVLRSESAPATSEERPSVSLPRIVCRNILLSLSGRYGHLVFTSDMELFIKIHFII